MLINETKLRVRYAETDQMGVAHHGIYLSYFEIGRTELLRNLGTTYRKMEEEGVMLPVISVICNYYGPAKYDDEIIIKTILKDIPGVKIKFDYEIYNAGKLISDGSSVLAFTNTKTKKPIKPPEWFISLIQRFLK